ncbi:MAG: hypothetical protein AAFX62_06775 [Pseudomonadota bacterium]
MGDSSPDPNILEKLDKELIKIVTSCLDNKSIAALEQTCKAVKAKIDAEDHASAILKVCDSLQTKCQKLKKSTAKVVGKDGFADLGWALEAAERKDKIEGKIALLKKGINGRKEAAYKPVNAAIKKLEAALKAVEVG